MSNPWVFLQNIRAGFGTLRIVARKNNDGDEVAVQKLAHTDELQVLSQLSAAPHVVRMLDYRACEDLPPLVSVYMQFCDGQDLMQILQESKQMPLQVTGVICLQLLKALSYLHTVSPAPIMHRDLRPSNILLRTNGRVKLNDFASSSFVVSDPQPVSSGKLSDYSSPELHMSAFHDCSTDMWSLGCVIYEMLTGTRFVSRNAAGEQIGKSGDLSSLVSFGPISKTIAQLLAEDPSQRPTSTEILGDSENCGIDNIGDKSTGEKAASPRYNDRDSATVECFYTVKEVPSNRDTAPVRVEKQPAQYEELLCEDRVSPCFHKLIRLSKGFDQLSESDDGHVSSPLKSAMESRDEPEAETFCQLSGEVSSREDGASVDDGEAQNEGGKHEGQIHLDGPPDQTERDHGVSASLPCRSPIDEKSIRGLPVTPARCGADRFSCRGSPARSGADLFSSPAKYMVNSWVGQDGSETCLHTPVSHLVSSSKATNPRDSCTPARRRAGEASTLPFTPLSRVATPGASDAAPPSEARTHPFTPLACVATPVALDTLRVSDDDTSPLSRIEHFFPKSPGSELGETSVLCYSSSSSDPFPSFGRNSSETSVGESLGETMAHLARLELEAERRCSSGQNAEDCSSKRRRSSYLDDLRECSALCASALALDESFVEENAEFEKTARTLCASEGEVEENIEGNAIDDSDAHVEDEEDIVAQNGERIDEIDKWDDNVENEVCKDHSTLKDTQLGASKRSSREKPVRPLKSVLQKLQRELTACPSTASLSSMSDLRENLLHAADAFVVHCRERRKRKTQRSAMADVNGSTSSSSSSPGKESSRAHQSLHKGDAGGVEPDDMDRANKRMDAEDVSYLRKQIARLADQLARKDKGESMRSHRKSASLRVQEDSLLQKVALTESGNIIEHGDNSFGSEAISECIRESYNEPSPAPRLRKMQGSPIVRSARIIRHERAAAVYGKDQERPRKSTEPRRVKIGIGQTKAQVSNKDMRPAGLPSDRSDRKTACWKVDERPLGACSFLSRAKSTLSSSVTRYGVRKLTAASPKRTGASGARRGRIAHQLATKQPLLQGYGGVAWELSPPRGRARQKSAGQK